jgi:hypothetical protein
MRYAAPAQVSDVVLSIGPVAVIDGFITVPDDMPQGDANGLVVNGFTPAEDAPQSAPTIEAPAKPTKSAEAPVAAAEPAADGSASL